ncbi:MAG: site-2 protease family protein [Candidatus Binatia bacterium]
MRPQSAWPTVPAEQAIERAEAAPRGRFPILNLLLFTATLVTTTVAGALNSDVSPQDLSSEWTVGLPFSLTLMSILLAHEMGHYLTARYYGVRATLPYFLPGPPILVGTFGAFIRMKSAPGDRRVLFDVGAAGPWAGLFIAVPAALYGLSMSELQPIPPSFTGLYFGDSLLFKLLSQAAVGPVPYGFDVMLHPVAMAGWFGLFVTVLNLLPVGQLDGGHVIYAMFGRRHRAIARSMLLGIVAVGFLGWNGWFVWAALLMLVGVDHPPTVDRDTPLDRRRWIFGWLTLALFVMTFVPVPITWIEGGVGPPPEELTPVRFDEALTPVRFDAEAP